MLVVAFREGLLLNHFTLYSIPWTCTRLREKCIKITLRNQLKRKDERPIELSKEVSSNLLSLARASIPMVVCF